jgi:hypothetical protein
MVSRGDEWRRIFIGMIKDDMPIERYAPRPISLLPHMTKGDWTIKRYAIRHGRSEYDEYRFEHAREMALAALPMPALEDGRVGVAFMIEHQGKNIDYLVLGWWDRQNELPLRVWVCPVEENWRPAKGSESICVWDLQIIWAERQAYVASVMQGRPTYDYASFNTMRLINIQVLEGQATSPA